MRHDAGTSMKRLIPATLIALAAAAVIASDYFLIPGTLIANLGPGALRESKESVAERVRNAEERSQNAKGVYMTSTVAGDRGRAASKLREDILKLLEETELDAVVIDVKETEGGLMLTDQLREFIAALHQKNIWVIARQVVFKDSSQEQAHPEWYLKRRDARLPDGQGRIWRDNRGGSWLDPASRDVWRYQVDAARAASDAGFDEIQFDYIRFPSDGDVERIIYPVYDPKRPKYEVLREFFAFLHDALKEHRPELVLSADLFGYVAMHHADLGIGQRLADIGENFDYVSLMVYPSHYYAGFEAEEDPVRHLPALWYPYQGPDISRVSSNHPYEVVHRSLLIATDVLAGRTATTASGQFVTTSTPKTAMPSKARLRPWLQDFDLAADSARGIRYDAAKVRAQIDAAEAAGASGWLLWNASNVYTRAALKQDAD